MSTLKKVLRAIFRLRLIPSLILRSMVRNWSPDLFGNQIRYWYYKKRFYSMGEETQVHEGSVIYFPELISVGARSSIGRYSELNPGPGETPCLIIGDDTWTGPHCFFRTANHNFDDPHTLFIKQGHEEKKIILGKDIYMGAHCIILGGTEVGDHCVVAAGSVVSTKIPPYSVVAGNPARVIGKRGGKEDLELLKDNGSNTKNNQSSDKEYSRN